MPTQETPWEEIEYYRTNAEDLSADKRPEEKLVIQNQEKASNLTLSDEKRIELNADQIAQLKTDIEGKTVETKSAQVEEKENPMQDKVID